MPHLERPLGRPVYDRCLFLVPNTVSLALMDLPDIMMEDLPSFMY